MSSTAVLTAFDRLIMENPSTDRRVLPWVQNYLHKYVAYI